MKQINKIHWPLIAIYLFMMLPKFIFAADMSSIQIESPKKFFELGHGLWFYMTEESVTKFNERDFGTRLTEAGYYRLQIIDSRNVSRINHIRSGLEDSPIILGKLINGAAARRPSIPQSLWMPEFSNIHDLIPVEDAPIFVDGSYWASAEFYFQVQKFIGTNDEIKATKKITSAKNSAAARNKAMFFCEVRSGWTDGGLNLLVMERAMLAKFTQHEKLKDLLLRTQDLHLVNFDYDAFWGCYNNGYGHNMLGEILMRVRKAIKDDTAIYRDRELKEEIAETFDTPKMINNALPAKTCNR